MPQIKYTPSALRDLRRLREFLRMKSPTAANRAGHTIVKAIQRLGQHPLIGRPAPNMGAHHRELPIDFGDDGYVALYRYEAGAITIIAIRHQKEGGY
ncbi:MAG: type II toxin-antitoxin system RelE/ParE family toxin [Pseudomonadota bacterium]